MMPTEQADRIAALEEERDTLATDYNDRLLTAFVERDQAEFLLALMAAAAEQNARERDGLQWIADLYDGAPTARGVADELADYSMILDNVGKVYCHVTGGRISKANTLASAVIAVSDDYFSELVREEAADLIEALTAERDGLRGGLEPFARLYDETVKCWPGTDTPRLPHRDDREAWGFNNATLMWGDFRTARALLTPPAPHSDEAGS